MSDIRPSGHGAIMTILRVVSIVVGLVVVAGLGFVSCEVDRAVTKWQVER